MTVTQSLIKLPEKRCLELASLLVPAQFPVCSGCILHVCCPLGLSWDRPALRYWAHRTRSDNPVFFLGWNWSVVWLLHTWWQILEFRIRSWGQLSFPWVFHGEIQVSEEEVYKDSGVILSHYTGNLPDFQPITLSLATLISSAFHPHL